MHYGFGHGKPLFLAIKHGNVDMVRFLLDSGANPNKISSPKIGIPQWHPLHYSVMTQNSAAFELLISRGANVNLRCKGGANKTALHFAAASGTPGMMKKLLNSRAYPSALDSNGYSPLWMAADRNSLDIVQLLVQGGAEADTWGTRTSPLWHALALRSGPLVECLFSNLQCESSSGYILQEVGEEDFSWALDETWYPKVIPNVIKQRDNLLATDKATKFSPSESNVYHILWIVRQLLKNESSSKRIAARILDMAHIWVSITTSRHEISIHSEALDQLQPYSVRKYPLKTVFCEESRKNLQPYLTLTLPAGLPERVIRQITFRTKSHDQGKIGQPLPDGYLLTNTDTGTWLEGAIVGDVGRRACSHVIHQNLPGVGVGRVHTNIWDLSNRTCHLVRDWFTRPRGGVKIGVYARAYFEGWVNQVESIEMEVRYAVGRADVQNPRPLWFPGPPLDKLGL